MNHLKIPARHSKQQKINKTPRDASPLTQFTNLNFEDLDFKTKGSQKFLGIPLTPTILSDSRTPSAPNYQKEPLSQRKLNILQPKSQCTNVYQPAKKKQLDASNSSTYQSSSGINHNQTSESIKAQLQNLVTDLKRKKSKENYQIQNAYGLPKYSPAKEQPKTKFIQLSLKHQDMATKQTTSFVNDDEQDLFYQIIKQRSAKSNQPQQCYIHIEKKAKYMKRDLMGSMDYLCCQCAIMNASKRISIYTISDNQLVTQEHTDHNLSPRCEPQSIEQKTKLYEMNQFLQKSIQMKQQIQFLLETVENLDDPDIFQKLSEQVTRLLAPTIEKYIQTHSTISLIPTDLIGEIQDQLTEMAKEVGKIKNDINANLDNIIQTMEMKPFRLIIQKYTQKLTTFDAGLKDYYQAMNKNFGVPNIYLISDQLKKKINEEPRKQSQQVYISFENKDSFIKSAQIQHQSISNDSIVLRSTETQQFLDYLQKDNDEKRFQEPRELKVHYDPRTMVLSPNFNDQFD